MECAKGKWIIFADADDYFSADFDSMLEQYKDAACDAIYFKTQCRMTDNSDKVGSRQWLCDNWSRYIDGIMAGEQRAEDLLIAMMVPWGKFVKRSFLTDNNIRFEEVPYGNDVMWATLVAVTIRPENFRVSEAVLYTLTERSNSLFNTVKPEAFLCRLKGLIRQQKVLRAHGRDMEINYLYYFSEADKISLLTLAKTMMVAIRYNTSLPPVYPIEKSLRLRHPILYMIVFFLCSLKARLLCSRQ